MPDPYTDPDFATAALVTIDTQRDVLDGGPLKIPGTSAALEPMCVLAQAFREAARPIVHVVRLYEPDGSNVDLCRRRAVQSGARILATGAPGSQLALELLPVPDLTLDCALLLDGGVQALGRARGAGSPLTAGAVTVAGGQWLGSELEAHVAAQAASGQRTVAHGRRVWHVCPCLRPVPWTMLVGHVDPDLTRDRVGDEARRWRAIVKTPDDLLRYVRRELTRGRRITFRKRSPSIMPTGSSS